MFTPLSEQLAAVLKRLTGRGVLSESDAATCSRRMSVSPQDFLVALKQMQAMGPMKQVLGLLPGVNAKALQAIPADDKRLKPSRRSCCR